MKNVYHFILTLLTVAMLALLTFAKINEITNWTDLSAYQSTITMISTYGPMVLVCLFAFGSLFGKALSKLLFVILVLLLIAFSIAMFAPQWIESIFKSTQTIFLLS